MTIISGELAPTEYKLCFALFGYDKDDDDDEDDEDDEDEDDEDEDEDEDDMKEAHGLLKKAAYKLKKENFTIDIKEDFDALTSGEALTENFKNKAKIIFESAVKKKVFEQLDTIESAYLVSISEEIEEHKLSLLEKVDAFLNYVCEEWLEENQIAVESGLKLEIAENFMEGVKKVFQESYIEVPETKVDIVDELTEQLEQTQSKLDEQIEKNIQLNKLVESHEKDTLIKEFSEGLADSQKEKFFSLAESLNYDNEESFKDGLKTLKESYFQKTVKTATEDRIISNQVLTESMDSYVKAISRWSK